MGNEQERTKFVDRLQKLWDKHHIICRKLPCLSRQTIDLYRFYILIREQNGFEQFSKIAKNRHWRDIASTLNIPNSSTTAFNLKQKYIHFKLFHYECKYDREGIDPEPILTEIRKQKETSIQELPQQVPTSIPHPSISNSVESTIIPNIKRRKLTSKDIRMYHLNLFPLENIFFF
jgi:AT-rich interactive domain-containing protein 1